MEEDRSVMSAGRRRRQVPRIPERALRIGEGSQSIRRKPAKIIWDHQNVAIPSHLSVETFLKNLKRNLKRYGFNLSKVDIYNTAFPKKMWSGRKPETKMGLIPNNEDLVVMLNWVEETPDPKRDDVDIEVMYQLLEYSLEKDPPFAVFIVAGDKDYISLVERLRTTNGVEVYMSSLSGSSKSLSGKDYFVDWMELTSKPHGYSPMPQQYLTPAQRPIPPPPTDDDDRSITVIMDAETSSHIPYLSQPDDLRKCIDNLVNGFGLETESVDGFFQFDDSEDSESLNLTKLAMELYYYGDGIYQYPLKYPALKGNKKKRTPDMDYVDDRIIKKMYHWGISTMPPAPMLIITCDIRIARAVRTLTAKGFTIYVATNLEISELKNEFEESGAIVIGWG